MRQKDEKNYARVDGLSTIAQQSELPRQAPDVVPQGVPERGHRWYTFGRVMRAYRRQWKQEE